MPIILRSRIVAALFPKLPPEELVLKAVSEFISRELMKKHTKPDKGGLLPSPWWYLSLFSEQRRQSNMQHINYLAVRPISKTASSGLCTSGAEILGILGFPIVRYRIGSTAEYSDTASF